METLGDHDSTWDETLIDNSSSPPASANLRSSTQDATAVRLSWDQRHHRAGDRAPPPAQVLAENAHLLPPRARVPARALDLACGLGGNALFLAGQGLDVTAWDSSAVAISGLEQRAAAAGVSIRAERRDVVARPPTADGFDVIVVSHFLERSLCPALMRALRPGGLLFYQTFTRERVDDSGPRNPAYRLRPNELPALFASLQLLVYREEGGVGDPARGFRNRAMLVGRQSLPEPEPEPEPESAGTMRSNSPSAASVSR